MADSFDQIVTGLGEAAIEAAELLGITEQQVMDALAQVNLSDLGFDKISFENLTGTELEEALGAVFSTLGDAIATAIIPAITEFQRNGEGAFETLIRVATQTRVVTDALDTMGIVLPQVATGVTQIGFALNEVGAMVPTVTTVMRDMTQLEVAQLGLREPRV